MADHIQINDVTPRIIYTADGVQTAFIFPFAIFKVADLEVYLDGVKQAAGYTVTGAGNASGGTATFAAAPPAGALVALRRKLALARTTDFQADGIIRAKSLNDELDYQVAATQQVAEEAARAVKRSPTSPSTADLTLPEPVAGRAIKWAADGQSLVNSDYDPDHVVPQAQAQAQAAAASAAQAATDRAAAQAAMMAAEAAADTAAADVANILASDLAASQAAANAANNAANAAQIAAEQAQQAAAAVGDPLSKGANLGDLPDPAAARAHLGLAAVAASGAYTDLSGLPALGTAATAMLGTAPGQVPTADQVPGLVQGVPAGCISLFAGAVAPEGWLLCDGSAVSRSAYAALFAVIGTLYGDGDGVDTFNLPDLRGRAPIGAGQGNGLSNRVLAAKLGAETHTLTVWEIPSHNHSVPISTSTGGVYNYCSPNGTSNAYLLTGNTGGGQAHNNMQPSLVLNFIIKT